MSNVDVSQEQIRRASIRELKMLLEQEKRAASISRYREAHQENIRAIKAELEKREA